MKAASVLPWILVLASVSAAAYFRTAQQKAESELVQLRADAKELASLREKVEELKRFEFLEPEVERLRKENAEVHKLRNEVRVLKEESKQLAGQVKVQQAQQVRQVRNAITTEDELSELERLRAENETLRITLAQLQPDETPIEERLEEYKSVCIGNLQQLSSAIQQWAVENQKGVGDIPEYEELMKYLATPPACPQGGSYTIAGVGKHPTCNMAGHQLQ